MMQGYVWIVIAIMKKIYMIYKMHKETFCFVRLLGNSLILIHTIYWRYCFGLKNHGGGGRIVVRYRASLGKSPLEVVQKKKNMGPVWIFAYKSQIFPRIQIYNFFLQFHCQKKMAPLFL